MFVLLCSAQPFQPAPDLYRAKPQDVPSWAEQGNFRFIRLNKDEDEKGQVTQIQLNSACLSRAEHLLEIAFVDMRQHVLVFGAELFAPPGTLGHSSCMTGGTTNWSWKVDDAEAAVKLIQNAL